MTTIAMALAKNLTLEEAVEVFQAVRRRVQEEHPIQRLLDAEEEVRTSVEVQATPTSYGATRGR